MDTLDYAREAIARSVAADAEALASARAFREGRLPFLDYITERAEEARARLEKSSDGDEPDTDGGAVTTESPSESGD